MKKTFLNTYLEQVQMNSSINRNTRNGLAGAVRHTTSSVAGGEVTNKNMAMKICYEKYCSNLMSDADLKDPVNQILHKKMIFKCNHQCYLNYLHQKKMELESKIPLYTGVLLANEQQKLKLIDWEISRISSKISKLGF
jgi:hypothetical protein